MIVEPCRTRRRRGAVALEFALTIPVLLLLSAGMVSLGQGISQFQMVANLAREGARWGSVRGAAYQQATGNPAPTAADVYNNAILPEAAGFPPGSITYTVAWTTDSTLGNLITVTLKYRWVPATYLSPVNMSSTAVMNVSY